MNAEPAPAPATFRVKFQSGQSYNRLLAGEGTLTISGEAYRFEGRRRRLFVKGPAMQVELAAADIANVIQAGTGIQFATPHGRLGKENTPFVFYAETAEEAAAIAARLPSRKDQSFLEAQSFEQQLLAVSASTGPSVTTVLIVANVAAFVVMGLLGAGWFETASMKPYLLYAANNGAATTAGEWWRLVTSMFVHYGLLHLALNMWALSQAGPLVEKLLGRPLFTLTYFGSGIVGGLATIAWHGDKVWSAGASGAIFGVYGALLGYLWREKHGIPASVVQPMLKSTLLFAGYNLFFGAVHPHIDNVCHLGGLLGGVLLGWITAMPLDAEARNRQWLGRLRLGLAAVVVLAAVGVAAAPRFDYRVREERAWGDLNDPQVKAEPALLKTGEGAITAFEQSRNEAAVRTWLQNDAMPFYQRWSDDLSALHVTPGLRTARRKDILLRVLQLKVKSYQALLTAIDRHEPGRWERYSADQEAIAAAIQEMAKARN